jgi:tryptophan synthase alpha chain
MSRIDERLAKLRAAGEGALVCFVTAGDPDADTTAQIVLRMAECAADVIELGVPFSDPIADGPSIQLSSQRALEAGMNVPGVLELVKKIRRLSDVPLVLMTYFNPALKYGIERFAGDASAAGADGVIMTDLTAEEAGEWRETAGHFGLSTIFLLAPTSTDTRIGKVAKLASGFIYCVSRTGVTGEQTEMQTGVRDLVDRIRAHTNLPVLVGFGISKPEHVREVCAYADGAVVGSALVNLIAERHASPDFLRRLGNMVEGLKSGTITR